MSHNPLAAELDQKAAELEGLRNRRSQLSSTLDWYSTFDRAVAEKRGIKQRDRCDDIEKQLAATQDEIAAATQQTSALRAMTGAGWDPRYWFSKDRAQAKEHFAAHKLADLDTRQTELNSRLDRTRSKLKETTRIIAKYDRFDQAAANAELVALDAELPIRQLEHDALADRKERLDRQLEGAVESLTELQADLKRATSSRSSLRQTRPDWSGTSRKRTSSTSNSTRPATATTGGKSTWSARTSSMTAALVH